MPLVQRESLKACGGEELELFTSRLQVNSTVMVR